MSGEDNKDNDQDVRPIRPAPPAFSTIRGGVNDLGFFNSSPAVLWDKAYMADWFGNSDNCHPSNSSFALGAIGGVLIGLGTGFFSPKRIYRPIKLPVPLNRMPRFHSSVTLAIIGGSIGWKIFKRAAISSLLFAALECDFREKLYKHKLYGSMSAAAVSGCIFGLRGGLPGIVLGSSGFCALPALYNFAYGEIN